MHTLLKRGYSQQMKSWPKLPVEVAISWLKKKPRSWKVADFGCGDARLEKGVPQVKSLCSKPSISKQYISRKKKNHDLERNSLVLGLFFFLFLFCSSNRF